MLDGQRERGTSVQTDDRRGSGGNEAYIIQPCTNTLTKVHFTFLKVLQYHYSKKMDPIMYFVTGRKIHRHLGVRPSPLLNCPC